MSQSPYDASTPLQSVGSEPLQGEQADAATYIADLKGEMAHLARTAGLGMLAYFLDMAQAEARSLLQDDEEPGL